MEATKKMTSREKTALWMESYKMEDAGKKEDALAFRMKMIPLEPWLAKIAKKRLGADFLRDGWNLTEVEAEFGPDWLDR
ncbi:MAG: hypothetical protein LBS97_06585 [Treponema sp.]|nr:hypothetical protein [Treponema sp.]